MKLLCSYLYLKLAKTPSFLFFNLLCFFLLQNLSTGSRGEGGNGGTEEVARKGVG
jgi:hypothetical protein